jgi:hypothetical protein
MTALDPLLAVLVEFVQCFTQPGFVHFKHFILAHAGLWGTAHCVTETLRLTRWHAIKHWTTPYVFMKSGRWSCQRVSQTLFQVLARLLAVGEELIVAIDDTLVKKWGRKFFGLGCYPDPTDKNPGASRRRVWGLCWVVLALLWERGRGQWFCFPLRALLFVPQKVCSATWPFVTKIELAARLVRWLEAIKRQAIVVVDNLYAKGPLREIYLAGAPITLVSRLRSNAALYNLPAPRRPGQRGRTAKRGAKRKAWDLWQQRGQRRVLRPWIYGKRVWIEAFVGEVIPSRTLGNAPILVVVFRQRSGKKWNIFFSTDLAMAPERLLELYAARFKIEDAFDELKTHGGLGDCRQRGFTAHHRHVTLCLVAYSLLRLLSLTLRGAEAIEAQPWWHPVGPPSVTRLRRAVAKSLGISLSLWSERKPTEIPALARAA